MSLRIVDAPLKPTVDGSEKIPTGGFGNVAISVDQISSYTSLQIEASRIPYVEKSDDFLDFALTLAATDLDVYSTILASTVSSSGLNWAGAIRVSNVASGGYVCYFPILDGIANSAFTVDPTKGKIDLATVTYIPNTSPPPSLVGSNDRAYLLCGLYRDRLQYGGAFISNRSIAAILWNKNSPNFLLFANNGALIIDTGVIAQQNVEYHVQVTLEGTLCKAYINGNLVVTTNITLPTGASIVGGIGSSTQAFGGGQIGGVDIWIDWYSFRYTPNTIRKADIGFYSTT